MAGVKPDATSKSTRGHDGAKWGIILFFGAVLIGLLWRFDFREAMSQILGKVEALGVWGPVLFVGVYVTATVLFLPGSILTLGAGALFGVVRGSLLVSVSSILGAICAFLIGRYFARDWVARKIAGNKAFAAIDRAVAREGWKIVGLTRLSPVFPFNLLNYGYGLTQVSLRDYALASWIGMMPGTVLYVYLGSLAQAGLSGQRQTLAQWVLYGVGLIATIVVTIFVTRIARRALVEKTQMEP